MTKYLECFTTAFNNYSQKDENSASTEEGWFHSFFNDSTKARPGYQFGWFSWLRHSKTLYPHILQLKQNLNSVTEDDAAKEILHAYFRSTLTKFNNHSFALYLLDAILMAYPEERMIWEQYYPPGKELVFYNGELYRGMRIQRWQLDEIFENGLDARESSKSIDDYAGDTTMGLGISTSKSRSVAEGYATAVVSRGIREAGQMIIIDGYLLKINYRGMGGIDILPTLKARGEDINAFLGASKKEVNIVGRIKPSDIEGAWYVGRKNISHEFIANPNYQAVNADDHVDVVLPERLRLLFR